MAPFLLPNSMIFNGYCRPTAKQYPTIPIFNYNQKGERRGEWVDSALVELPKKGMEKGNDMAGYKLTASILNRKRSAGKIADGAALFFYRNKDGSLTAWQRIKGKDERVASIVGDITQTMLANIRQQAMQMKIAADSPTDVRESMTFEQAWESFLKRMIEAHNSKWSEHTREQATARMWNYVAHREIWKKPVSEISSDDVLDAVVDARARYPKLAPKVIALIGQVLASVAGKEGLSFNAARALKEELKSTEKKVEFERHLALLDVKSLGKLLYDIDNSMATLATRVAMTLQAYSVQRTGEVVAAQWKEFTFQDDGSVIWRIPRARMKIGDWRKKPYDQVLWLPSTVAKQIKRLSIKTDFLFLPRCGKSNHISVESLPAAYWKMGYRNIAVPHGWRSSLKTIAEDQVGDDDRPMFASSWIESVLDHSPPGVAAHYQRSKAERGMALVMKWWGGLLDAAHEEHTNSLLRQR